MAKEKFEDYLSEVEKVISELEDGSLDLEKSFSRYEAGIKALKKCYEILAGMEKKIETLTRPENLINHKEQRSVKGHKV